MPKRNAPVKNRNTNQIIIIGVIAAIVIVGGLLVLNATFNTPQISQVSSVGRELGNANAPIVVEEYSDLQ